jgi:hypothetical protein
MNANEIGFCSSSRTGEINRVRNRPVRYLLPQPGSPAFRPASSTFYNLRLIGPEIPGFRAFVLVSRLPVSQISGAEWRKVSGPFPKNFRSAETIGGD